MAKTSAQVLERIQKMTKRTPDFKSMVASAYEQPVLRPLVEEAANLESQYLPAIFEPLANAGTGAADLSPMAKLAAIGGSIGRLGARVNSSNRIQDYYGMQVDNLANTMANAYDRNIENKWRTYSALSQREDEARRRAAEDRQFNYMKGLYGGGGAGQPDSDDTYYQLSNGSFMSGQQANNLRNLVKDPVGYYNSNPGLQKALSPVVNSFKPIANMLNSRAGTGFGLGAAAAASALAPASIFPRLNRYNSQFGQNTNRYGTSI